MPAGASPADLQNKSEESLDVQVEQAIKNDPPPVVVKKVKTPVVKDLEVMTPNANEEIKEKVLKDTNENIKFTIKKFLFAMGGVLISSIILFIILTVMNKRNLLENLKNNDKAYTRKEELSNGNFGENEALKVFFDKTK